jgi:2-dehydro-3-deoxyphosphooctonate aldolase (KDO 8-P synthase)
MLLVAGPCVLERLDIALIIADEIRRIEQLTGKTAIFKGSFDKANRTSLIAGRGPGIYKGLELLQDIKTASGLPILTDIHESWQAAEVAKVVDVIQIPAFLCRQTDLIMAAAATGKSVNIKKGQFMAPGQMIEAVKKARQVNQSGTVYLTERGTSFGYGDLVVDFRSIPRMQALSVAGFRSPVLFDAGHSVQRYDVQRHGTGGDRELIPVLARAGIAAGADGLYIETHPDPESSLSDSQNMLRLGDLADLVVLCNRLYSEIKRS